MSNLITLVVGFDQSEAVAYHTFCQSVIEFSTIPVQFIPLTNKTLSSYIETHIDGSNDFIYSRFLTPYLCNYKGWAIFADGDMICQSDINELWSLRDNTKAVQVVKHDYKTKSFRKYLGNKNENYPRKNWSSLILWNCGHTDNAILTPDYIMNSTGSHLHRFNWLNDSLIGELPLLWNWLAIEYPENPSAKIIHYTLGTPCFLEYSNTSMSDKWHIQYHKAIEGLNRN